MSIKAFFQQKGYDVYWILRSKLHICKDKSYMSVEIIIDTNWVSQEYLINDVFIPKHSIHTNCDWLCVMNRDKTNFYIVPMCVVKASQQVSKESNGSMRNILYAMDTQMVQQSNKGAMYFV